MSAKIESDIIKIRELEDSIRATKKYTEGLFTKERKHPIQGEEFSSKLFTKMYEVYLEVGLPGKDVPPVDGIIQLYHWWNSPSIQVVFRYDYRNDKAALLCQNGEVEHLKKVIPGFRQIMARISLNATVSAS